jgi:hypothetical protein
VKQIAIYLMLRVCSVPLIALKIALRTHLSYQLTGTILFSNRSLHFLHRYCVQQAPKPMPNDNVATLPEIQLIHITVTKYVFFAK